ncbi:hypothetical protein [Promicromonospora soli]|uniref:Uncharacterized protein n=1 Tax=Promicromonospora soli TaxID=2035533 RepID=A0A919FZV7_9MICO|nr:hypothetical protein [Promicromonospora soli]GHH75470.1 hypothetical protein GCM10017772_31920 [Promicromonospora soli]
MLATAPATDPDDDPWPWDEPSDRPDRVARDVAVAQRSDGLFRGLLRDHDHAD